MKRVLVAAALGGLLLVGTPTLALSAQRNDTKAEKGADKAAADKGGDSKGGDKAGKGGEEAAAGKAGDKAADRKGDNKGGDRGDNKGGDRGDNKGGDRGDKGDKGDRGDRDGRYRHGYHRGDRYYYGGGYYYGEPYECWYGPSGAYNCEPYGGDYYGGGYDPGYGYRGYYRNRSVTVSQKRFNPPEVFAYPGQEVLWVFRDGNVPHTVTADNNSFDSGKVTEGEFRLVFEQPGTYSYHCSVHPEMKGRVIVQG